LKEKKKGKKESEAFDCEKVSQSNELPILSNEAKEYL
jgi:hypothetical protein